jgi:hypothetical protein
MEFIMNFKSDNIAASEVNVYNNISIFISGCPCRYVLGKATNKWGQNQGNDLSLASPNLLALPIMSHCMSSGL